MSPTSDNLNPHDLHTLFDGELHPEELSAVLAELDRNPEQTVEVVANGEGLAMLRAGLSRQGDRIRAIAAEYPRLAFVACQNNVDRLRREEGVEVELLAGLELTRSGVIRVVKRQREGWAYIQG